MQEIEKNTIDRTKLIYPIPLKVPVLPAAIKVPGLLTALQCQEIIAVAKKEGFRTISKDRFEGSSTTEARSLDPELIEFAYEAFTEAATDLNRKYWRLNISGIYEKMRVLRYNIGDSIRPHIDADYRAPDTSKITCSIQLVPKESFTGGIFTVAETEDYDLDIGDAVIFPSHMIHAVSPVESGERIVISAWIHGSSII